MKKFLFIAVVACFLFSSCGQKEEEQNKTVAASTVQKSGMHSDLLNVKGDVKILLSKDGDRWTVSAVIPIENAKKWSEVPDTDESMDEYFSAEMDNIKIEFLDENGATIDHSLYADHDIIKSVLASENIKTENMTVKMSSIPYESYEKALEVYNKVKGVSIKNMELYKRHSSSGSSSSSSYSSSDDDYDYDDDDLDKALEDYDKAVDAAKKTVDAYKSLYDALD